MLISSFLLSFFRQNNTVWYHQGPEGLVEARMFITKYSFVRAKQRLAKAREYYASMPESQRKARYQEYLKVLRVSLIFAYISSNLHQIMQFKNFGLLT